MHSLNPGRPWTDEEKQLLRELAGQGLGKSAIAERLNRSIDAVRTNAYKLGISLRMRDAATGKALHPSGLILGQGRGERWARTDDPLLAEHRRAVLGGTVDEAAVDTALLGTTRGRLAPRLCVVCGEHPAISARHRLCRSCYGEAVTSLAEEPAETLEGPTEWRRLRQAISYHKRRIAALETELAHVEQPKGSRVTRA